MYQGQLLGIFLTARKRDELLAVDQVEAVVGGGLVGDRYFRRDGHGKTDQEITLIEMEALEALSNECQITLQPAQARRNLLTRGVPLNHLVGREFRVGEVILRGLRLCEPCGHLEALTLSGVQAGLCHRGGLRAQVVRGGILRTRDIIEPLERDTEMELRNFFP